MGSTLEKMLAEGMTRISRALTEAINTTLAEEVGFKEAVDDPRETETKRKPTLPALGETVHWVSLTGQCKAALVTDFKGDATLGLTVFHPGAVDYAPRSPFGGSMNRIHGSWHYNCGRS